MNRSTDRKWQVLIDRQHNPSTRLRNLLQQRVSSKYVYIFTFDTNVHTLKPIHSSGQMIQDLSRVRSARAWRGSSRECCPRTYSCANRLRLPARHPQVRLGCLSALNVAIAPGVLLQLAASLIKWTVVQTEKTTEKKRKNIKKDHLSACNDSFIASINGHSRVWPS